jgi:hypothetical protein
VLCSPEEPNKGYGRVVVGPACVGGRPLLRKGPGKATRSPARRAVQSSERWLNGRGVPKEPAGLRWFGRSVRSILSAVSYPDPDKAPLLSAKPKTD